MKKILLIILLNICFCAVLPAQDKIDRLIEQQAITNAKLDKLTEQVIELTKQQAVTVAKVDSLEKSVEKRFDMQGNFMVSIMSVMGAVLVAVLGFIGFVLWDRSTALKPIEGTTAELKREVDILKQKDLKHEEKEQKAEKFFKKLIEKYPDLANIA